LAELVASELISKIVVDQYAGPPDEARCYLTTLPTAAAQYFGPSLELCAAGANPNGPLTNGAGLAWTSTSAVTFESGRTGTLAVATVFVSKAMGPTLVFRPRCSDCLVLPTVSGLIRYRSIASM
jgi:hypothetical protein